MKNLIIRTISGAIFVAIIIFSAIYAPLIFSLFFLVMALLGLREFQKLTQQDNRIMTNIPVFIAGALIYGLIAFYAHAEIDMSLLWLILPVFFMLASANLLTRGQSSLTHTAIDTLGILYVVIPLALLNVFLNPTSAPGYHTPWAVLGMFLILWAHDTFAYLTGSMFGRHPLYKSISPKKSLEGSIGGLGFAVIAAYVISIFSPVMEMWQWMAIALIVAVFGTLGDLTESLLKRKAGVKDSGTIMPGHGGVLDRFDSILFVSPIVLILILLTNS